MKNCKICKKELQENEFPKAGIKNDKQYYRAKCPTCHQTVKRGRRHRIAKWFEDYKKTLKCNRCFEDDFRVLEFHHVNDDKEFNVSDMVKSFSIENIIKEINKCGVVCSNCHKRLHYNVKNGL